MTAAAALRPDVLCISLIPVIITVRFQNQPIIPPIKGMNARAFVACPKAITLNVPPNPPFSIIEGKHQDMDNGGGNKHIQYYKGRR